MELPPPQDRSRPYSLAVVCLGNICRSPTAQVVLERRLADTGLADAVRVTSAGTGDWHVGEPMDRRAAGALRSEGYDSSRHRAQQVDPSWFERYDALLVMDASNRADVRALAPTDEDRDRVLMFRAWDPKGGPDADVPDPWYGDADGFADVLELVERTSAELVEALGERVRGGES